MRVYGEHPPRVPSQRVDFVYWTALRRWGFYRSQEAEDRGQKFRCHRLRIGPSYNLKLPSRFVAAGFSYLRRLEHLNTGTHRGIEEESVEPSTINEQPMSTPVGSQSLNVGLGPTNQSLARDEKPLV